MNRVKGERSRKAGEKITLFCLVKINTLKMYKSEILYRSITPFKIELKTKQYCLRIKWISHSHWIM